ncbi:hypothetical protein Smic_84650 [Streptomyces microflavus]|uniref:Sugar ABC transporter substrate-binding protein n=1 Tax=Streptomyces microflavus TaxID=1919 RepID=A0A7J0D622_STRMI|nr:hypothetical protein Smic_84650 [Streptomyces microflavus]
MKPDSIENPKSRELITAFNTYQDGKGLAFYPDWPAPGYYDTWMGATQNLMNGGKPHAVLDELQAPYEKYTASRR